MPKQAALSIDDQAKQSWVVRLILCFHALAVLVPWQSPSWLPPCNNAWVLALHQAFLTRSLFGVDVVFTSGPLGLLYYGIVPATQWVSITGWTVIGLAVGLLSARLALSAGWARWWWPCAIAALAVSLGASADVPDASVFLLISMLLMVTIFNVKLQTWEIILIGTALGIATWVKFSWLIAIVPIVALRAAIEALRKRKLDWLIVSYTVSVAVLWFACGQGISNILPFVRNSLEIASGFSAAMQRSHTMGLAITSLYFVLASQFLLLLWSVSRGAPSSLLGLIGIAYIIFIVFKAGFIRHDHHQAVATAYLAALTSIALTCMPAEKRSLGICLFAFGFGVWIFALPSDLANPSYQPRLKESFGFQGHAHLFKFLTGQAQPVNLYNAEMEALRRKEDFRGMSGSVDIYPWGGLDSVVAHGLTYRPRPVFESYSAYTGRLAGLNRDYLQGPSAPDNILFASRVADGRYPSLDDGLSWPVIWSRYAPVENRGGYLLLKRRDNDRPYSMELISEQGISAGIWTDVPEVQDGAIWMELDVPLSPTGSLTRLLYKPETILIRVEIADGRELAFRMVPAVAAAGMLCSPLLRDTGSFAVAMENPGDPRLDPLKVRRILLTGGDGLEVDYDFTKARVRFSRFSFQK